MTGSAPRRMNVLLDLDGTLTDPREGIVRCIKHALTRLGDSCPSDTELLRYIGPPLQTSFSAMFGVGSPKVAKAIELYRERFSAIGILENKVYPGIPAALKSLKRLGATLIVATSKPTIFAERIVNHFHLGNDIRAVFGSELDGTRSDKAELIAHILKAQSITPTTTCMVGDREHDVRGANTNKILAIGALWGYGSQQELLDAGAAYLCQRPEDLVEVLSSNSALVSDAAESALRASSGAPQRGR
jgi:phosphoglycolate phosphatase